MGLVSYQAGLTKFSDLTLQEFKVKYTGLQVSKTHGVNASSIPSSFNGSNPSSVDWREHLVEVKDQKHCGSCWSFSAACSLEFGYNIANKEKESKNVSLSEQQMVDCSGGYGNHGCNGGLMDKAFNYVIKYGEEKEKDYSYKAKD